MAAALASLLAMPLEDVPEFEEMARDKWQIALWNWLNARGYSLFVCYPEDAPQGYVIANGMSPRGLSHSVIYKNGKLVHDPHPSRAGIESVREYWQIWKVEAEADA